MAGKWEQTTGREGGRRRNVALFEKLVGEFGSPSRSGRHTSCFVGDRRDRPAITSRAAGSVPKKGFLGWTKPLRVRRGQVRNDKTNLIKRFGRFSCAREMSLVKLPGA